MGAMQQLLMCVRGMLGSRSGSNGGGWQLKIPNWLLMKRRREAGSARHDNNIRVCRSGRTLLMPAEDVSGIHSNQAGAWLQQGDFGGWGVEGGWELPFGGTS